MAPTRTRQRAARIAAILGILSLVSGVAGGLDPAGAAVTTVSVDPAPNPAITDGSTTQSTATVAAGSGVVSDISVTVAITHTRVGDLTYTLTHVATGTSVVLLDRPGTVDASNGDNSNLLASSPVTFTQGPATAAELMGSGPGMSTNATVCLTDGVCTYQSHASLSTLTGLAATGDWRLTVTDTSGMDTGTFDKWSITVTSADAPAAHAPVAADDAFGTDEDTPITVTAPGLLDGDTDVDAGTTLTVAGTGAPAHGDLTAVGSDGSFTYTPDAGWHGVDSFTYTVSDGALTDTGTATITVASVNDPPVADDDVVSTAEDTPVTVAAPGVLADDSDADGDGLTAAKLSDPTKGSVTVGTDGGFTYVPDSDANGLDSFTYSVSDGTATDTGTVTVTIGASNDLPTIDDVTFTTDEDTPRSVTAAEMMALTDDADGDELTFELVGEPGAGTVDLDGDGAFTYTPDPDAHGADSFVVAVDDGAEDPEITALKETALPAAAGDATAVVTIEVLDVNDPPVAQDDSLTTDEDTAGAVDVVANDGDPEGDPLEVTEVTQGTHGSVECSAGTCTYTPDPGFSGADAFTYTVSDPDEDSDGAQVQVTVLAAEVDPQDPECDVDQVLVDGICTTPDNPQDPECDVDQVLVDGICTTPDNPQDPQCDVDQVLVDGICTTPEAPPGPVDEEFGVTTTTAAPLPRVSDVGAGQQAAGPAALPRTGGEGFRLVPLGLGLLLLGASLMAGRPRRRTA